MKIKKKTGRGKKFIAIFISFLMIFTVFSFAFQISLPFVKAQEQYGWCVQTFENKICQPNTPRRSCQFGFSLTMPTDCRLVYCVTKDGSCKENVPYKACVDEGGIPSEGVPDICQQGCCGIAGRPYGILTKGNCLKLAQDRGIQTADESVFKFFPGMTDERQCAEQFSGEDRGCCVIGPMQCKYTYRKECSATFKRDWYCSEIPECGTKPNASLGCGVFDVDANNIYWFDSVGNQESLNRTCTYPMYICTICDNESGCTDEENNSISVKKGEPYCKSTMCSLDSLAPHQNLTWEGGRMKIKWIKPSGTLVSGHSICHNFYTGQAQSGKETMEVKYVNYSREKEGKNIETFSVEITGNEQKWENDFPRKSTGLQNQKVICNVGRLQVIGGGVDRKKLCFEAKDNITAYFVNAPDYKECMECGKGGIGYFDYLGDVFRGGADISVLPWGAGSLLAKMANECTKGACEGVGKFPNGESWCVWRWEVCGWMGSGKFAGLEPEDFALDPSCVPRYPPGTTQYCGKCGDAGDAYDMCEDVEAWALGDCQFREYDPGRKTLLVFMNYAKLSPTALFNFYPYYVFAATLVDCIGAAGGWWQKTKAKCGNTALHLITEPWWWAKNNAFALAAIGVGMPLLSLFGFEK